MLVLRLAFAADENHREEEESGGCSAHDRPTVPRTLSPVHINDTICAAANKEAEEPISIV